MDLMKSLSAVVICLSMELANVTLAEEGLVAYYSFDEGSGSVVADESGKGNSGTIHGATWVKGKSGSALRFDGKDDYIQCWNKPGLDVRDAITIEVWVCREGAGVHYILCEAPGLLGIEERYGTYSLISKFPGKWSDIVRSEEPAPIDRWTHLAFTWNMQTGDAFVYHNGMKKGVGVGKRGEVVPGDYLVIGAIGPAQ